MITYYLHDKDAVDAYLKGWREWGERIRAEQAKNPTPTTLRLARIKAEREAARRQAAESPRA